MRFNKIQVGSGEYYFPPPECINNVSGKIEWNLTSAQIRVKKEEQKKIRMEEEEKKEEEKKRKDNEDGSKSCQSLDQKSGDEVVGRLKGDPSPDDQQEHVKLRKVQLPLLEVAESSLENYSFHHRKPLPSLLHLPSFHHLSLTPNTLIRTMQCMDREVLISIHFPPFQCSSPSSSTCLPLVEREI